MPTLELTREELVELVALHVMRDYREGGREAIADTIDNRIKDAVDGLVSAVAEKRIEALVDSHLASAVDAYIADGWRTTNSYGEPTGNRVSLATRVAAIIDRRESNDRHWLESKVAAAVSDVLRATKVRDRISATVDSVIQAKLTETLKSALGLR